VQRDALEAEHVIAVGGDLDLELGRFVFGARRVIFCILVKLDAEVEAEILELVGREAGRILVSNSPLASRVCRVKWRGKLPLAKLLEEGIFVHPYGRHSEGLIFFLCLEAG